MNSDGRARSIFVVWLASSFSYSIEATTGGGAAREKEGDRSGFVQVVFNERTRSSGQIGSLHSSCPGTIERGISIRQEIYIYIRLVARFLTSRVAKIGTRPSRRRTDHSCQGGKDESRGKKRNKYRDPVSLLARTN